jgi:hypothetical protein
MTMVLNCMTPEFVVQVSDRRLTYPDGSVADDRANKAVMYCGHFFIGYTGLAVLGDPTLPRGARTDWWIADVLSPADLEPSEAFNHLASEATKAVGSSGCVVILDEHRSLRSVGHE